MQEVVRSIHLGEAASLVGCSQDELLREAAAGRLQVAVTLESLLSWKAARNTMSLVPPAVTSSSPGTFSLTLGPWTQIAPFAHMWPDETVEPYVEAYQTTAQINNRSRIIIVALGERTSTGMTDRARGIVFYGAPPKERALVEFSGNGTLQTATRYACPIKLRGSHSQLRPGEPVPEEYVDMPMAVFSSVVQGPYASNAVAVVVETSDLQVMLNTMARHGVIRGVYKGWL